MSTPIVYDYEAIRLAQADLAGRAELDRINRDVDAYFREGNLNRISDPLTRSTFFIGSVSPSPYVGTRLKTFPMWMDYGRRPGT